jgi:hypothetical protein
VLAKGFGMALPPIGSPISSFVCKAMAAPRDRIGKRWVEFG